MTVSASPATPAFAMALRRFALWAGTFGLLLLAMPLSRPLFARLFPHLDRPLYEQHAFAALALSHLALVAASGLCAAVIGIGAAIFVTRRSGREFRQLVETLAAIAQTVPPVAVLALAVPSIGFGFWPAFLALALFSILPICENALAGLDSVPASAMQAGEGLGMTPGQRLRGIELPLAAPVILAGLRTSLVINTGTAAIASTVGAVSLGSPIILGLNGNNTAYVLQGAVLMTALALVVDSACGLLQTRLARAG